MIKTHCIVDPQQQKGGAEPIFADDKATLLSGFVVLLDDGDNLLAALVEKEALASSN